MEGGICSCQQQDNQFADQPQQQMEMPAQEPTFQQNAEAPKQEYRQYRENTGEAKTREAEWISEKGSAMVSGAKNMYAEILPILKKPVTATKNIADRDTPAIGMQFIIAKAVIILIMVLIAAARLSSKSEGYITIPYIKVMLLSLLLTIGVDCLEALLLKVFAGVFNGFTNLNAMLSVVGSRALYDTLLSVVTVILALIVPGFAIIVFAIGRLILPYVQFGGYGAVVDADENKKVYAYFIAKACMLVTVCIVIYILGVDIIVTVFKGLFGNIFSYDSFLNSLF